MEYAKKIIFNLNFRKKIDTTRIIKWTSSLKKIIINNKLIVTTLSILVIMMSIDIVLVNSFFELLSRLY